MATPLYDAVEGYLRGGYARFHMPGHKGANIPPLGPATTWDITEVRGADSLYEAQGPIAATEARYAALYGAVGSFLSAGGSTLCIQAMLALAARPGEKILCGRGVHTAAVNAMALLDLRPEWIFPELDGSTGLSLAVTAAQVAEGLDAHPEAAAVYLTSPDYFGVTCDIGAISAVCRDRGVPLLVDNAHGAHLRFLPEDRHPMTLGADLCCDSLHKTLPVLTGGAALHVGNARYLADAKRKMSLFGSTSPSYLILLSLDCLLPYLERQCPADLERVAGQVAALERLARSKGFLLPTGKHEPLRLAVGFAPLGLDMEQFRAHLDHCGVEPEYLSSRFCVFLAGGHNTDQDFAKLEKVLREAPAGVTSYMPLQKKMARPRQAMALRDALFARYESIPVDQAEGRVCAGTIAPCPPGIPLVMPGELLDKSVVSALKSYGNLTCNVVK